MAYTKTDWVNGVTKVNQGNLNNNEDGTKTNDDKLVNTFSADINAYFGNTKLGDDFQDDSVWTSVDGVQTADTTNIKIGSQSLRITEPNLGVSFLNSVKNNITLDYTLLNNGEISTDDDYIVIIYFMSDSSKFTNVEISLSQDATFSSTNRKKTSISSSVTGFNFIKIKKSSFITDGTGSFGGIQSLRVLTTSTATAQNEFVSFQLIQLVKKDPLSLIPNPFQRFGVRDFEINIGEWFVGEEFGEIVWKELDVSTFDEESLIGTIPFSNFILFFRTITETTVASAWHTWFINGSNFISVQLDNNLLRIRERISGVTTNHDFDVNLIYSANDIVEIKIIKNGTSVKVIGIIGSQQVQGSITTSIVGPGFLTIGTGAISTKVLAASITEISHAHHSDISEVTNDFRVDDLIQSHTNIEWLGGTW